MTSVAARELADGEVVFVGIGLPNLACNLARRTHEPNLVLIYESGAVGATPSRLPVSIGDPALVTGSLMVCGMADVFQLFLQNGRIEVGFLGGAQVDRHGNINTTVIGDYKRPKVRLPGSCGRFSTPNGCTSNHDPRARPDPSGQHRFAGGGPCPAARRLVSHRLLRAPSRRGDARWRREWAARSAARQLTGRDHPLAGTGRCLAGSAPTHQSPAARGETGSHRLWGHARRHRRLRGHARMPLRALERGAHGGWLAGDRHVARDAARRGNGSGAAPSARALACGAAVCRDGDGEPSRRIAPWLYGAAP